MRGRKPELRTIEGGLSAEAELPEAPDSLDEDGVREWNRVVPEMVRRGAFSDGVASSLEAYCAAVAACRRCQKRLAQDGDFIETKTGLRRHPAHQVITAMTTEMRRLASELGLTRGRPLSGGDAPGGAAQDDLFSKLGIV